MLCDYPEISTLFDTCAAIFKSAGRADAELADLETTVASVCNNMRVISVWSRFASANGLLLSSKSTLTEMQQAVLLKVWRTHRTKVPIASKRGLVHFEAH